MSRGSWLSVLALTILLGFGSPALAQMCSGGAPISDRNPFQVGGSVLLAENATGFSGIAQGGNSLLFGGFQFGRISIDGDEREGVEDIWSTVIGGRAGAQFTYDMNLPLYLCPVFSFSHQWASDIGDIDDLDASTTTFAFGGDVGLLAGQSGSLKFVPTAGLYFGRVSLRTEFEGVELVDEAETGGLFNAGFGLVFQDRFSVTPLISFPFGFGSDSDPTFSITALFSFGR
jgi:hypothetical protein